MVSGREWQLSGVAELSALVGQRAAPSFLLRRIYSEQADLRECVSAVLLGWVRRMIKIGSDKGNARSDKCGARPYDGVLRKRRDFLRVQHYGTRQIMPHFILQAIMVLTSPVSPVINHRVGVTASKKVGNAVARNRAKRRMRALFRQLNPTHTHFGADYVLVARHSLVQADWAELSADFSKAAKRIHKKLSETEV